MIKRITFSLLLASMLLASFPATTAAQLQGGTETQPAGDTTGVSGSGAQFRPLTSLPGITDAAASANLPAFLNSLYGICVGAAAILAVLQIVRGGVTYMLGDSVTEKREARHHIALAVFGLVLVLAPAIVFGVIDKRILDMSIDVSGLVPTQDAVNYQYASDVQQNLCESHDARAYVQLSEGQTCGSVKGPGWGSAEAACCGGNNGTQTCCVLSNSFVPPPPPVGTSGDFNYSYTIVANAGTSDACIEEEDVMQFETMALCIASEGTADGQREYVTQRCDGTNVNPPQSVLDLDMCE